MSEVRLWGTPRSTGTCPRPAGVRRECVVIGSAGDGDDGSAEGGSAGEATTGEPEMRGPEMRGDRDATDK